MKPSIVFLTLLLSGYYPKTQTETTGWHHLFNGRDLDGWVVPENNRWWTVQDGILIGKNDPGLKGSILWTKKNFRDFVLKLDFKFGDGTVDSGVFLRTVNEQIQLGISGKYQRDMTCSPYIGSKSDYPVEARGVQELLKPGDWNALKIKAKGNHYEVWLNGKQVLSYISETAIEEGPIGLQVHPNKPMEIEFRNILCAEL